MGRTRGTRLAASVALAAVLSGAVVTTGASQEAIKINGSTGVAPLIAALYGGASEADISTEVTFEDGRKGVLSARVTIRDMKTGSPSGAMEKAA